DVIPLGRHGLELRDGVGEGNLDDRVAVERGHRPPALLMDEVGGLEPVARRQYAIAGSGGSAPLNVPEDSDPRLEAGALLDLPREGVPDPSEADVAELVGGARLLCDGPRLARGVGQFVGPGDG